jgi:hypothetical protein
LFTVPTGDVSVMPHACTTNAPKSRSKASTIARGTAAPPMTTRRSASSARGVAPALAACCSSISQTVGTPSASVTRSSRSSA